MSASTSTAPPPPSPQILLFARGLLALFDLWPALTIAVKEEWGGPDSSAKKTWMASTLIDEFESRATYLPASPAEVDPATANEPPLDHDDVADMLQQMLSDEFDANIEDGSIDAVAGDIVRLWRDVLAPQGRTAEDVVGALERKAAEVSRTGVNAQSGGGAEEVDDSGSEGESGDEEEGEMDVDEVPKLVEREKEERQEPVVDDDGFTLVQKKGRR